MGSGSHAKGGSPAAPSRAGRWLSFAERFQVQLVALAVFAITLSCFSGRFTVYRDSYLICAPSKDLIGQSLRRGELPVWNPHQYLGLPFAADILAGCFYPLNLLYAVLPFASADRIFLLLHFPLAALGVHLLLRELRLGAWASLLGGVVFACCGYLVNMSVSLPYLLGPALAPFALWAALKRGHFLAWGLLGGAVLSLQVLAGEPQSAAVTAVLSLVIILVSAQTSREFARAALKAGTTLLAALGMSLIQVLPTLEVLGNSFRKGGLGFEQASFFSFHPARLWELFWPHPFGTLFPKTTFWGFFAVEPSPMNIRHPWSFQNYLGLAVLALAICGFFRARKGLRLALAAGAIFFLALSLGHHTPVFKFLHSWVPFFDIFRYPSKYLAYFMLFLALAAAVGMEHLLLRLEERPRRALAWALGLVIVTAVVFSVALGFSSEVVAGLGGLHPGTPPHRAALQGILQGGLHLLALNTILAGILLLVALGTFPPRFLTPALLLVLAVDWSLVNFRGVPVADESSSTGSLAARVISPGGRPPLGAYRIHREDFGFRDAAPGTGSYFARRYRWQRDTLQSNLGDREGFENLLGINESVPQEGLSLLDTPTARTLEVFNVGYLLSRSQRRPVASARSELLLDDLPDDLSLRRLTGAFPRAYWVPEAVAAPDTKKAMELFPATDLTRRVILTTDEPLAADSTGGALLPAAISSYAPGSVLIDAEAPAPGWLVLSDRFYPGWFAEIDGKPTTIYQANVLVRAVRFPGGRHRVRFDYHPRSLRIGGWISGLSWLVALGVWCKAAGAFARLRHRPGG